MNEFKSYIATRSVIALSPDEGQRRELVQGLELAGCSRVIVAKTVRQARQAMTDGDVSAVMVALPQADTAMLRDVTAFAMAANCAVALFLESRANIHLGEIVDAGICSVVIDGLAASRIPDLLETTLYRYDKMRGLQIQLEKALSALEKRKLVDRAKALLIEQRGITEPEAHRLLQRAAMNKSCSINDIAQTIIIASEV